MRQHLRISDTLLASSAWSQGLGIFASLCYLSTGNITDMQKKFFLKKKNQSSCPPSLFTSWIEMGSQCQGGIHSTAWFPRPAFSSKTSSLLQAVLPRFSEGLREMVPRTNKRGCVPHSEGPVVPTRILLLSYHLPP